MEKANWRPLRKHRSAGLERLQNKYALRSCSPTLFGKSTKRMEHGTERYSHCGAAVAGWFLLLICCAPCLLAQETIVAIRHAEKPSGGLGQLSCKGLNRALALPSVLTQRFGKPEAIYAPNPTPRVLDGPHLYFYVRPLATIEPTAISLGLPVNTGFGYRQIKRLKTELTARSNQSKLIFVAWEHTELDDLAKLMLRSFGKDASAVPKWPDDDYDRIYIFKIDENRGKRSLTFQVDQEGLNDAIKESCP
jgi:hypothetical protein